MRSRRSTKSAAANALATTPSQSKKPTTRGQDMGSRSPGKWERSELQQREQQTTVCRTVRICLFFVDSYSTIHNARFLSRSSARSLQTLPIGSRLVSILYFNSCTRERLLFLSNLFEIEFHVNWYC
jgi:hypothetical protein